MWWKIILSILAVLAIGIAIPKLTVHDTVMLSDTEKTCAYGIFTNISNGSSMDRVALMLGKGAITEKRGPTDFGGKAYTLFRIPLGILHGQPGESYGIDCLLAAPSAPGFAQVPETKPKGLTDGERIEWLGVYHASDLITNGQKAFSSDELGFSFKYPNGYLLFENKGTNENGEFHNFSIAPERAILEAINRTFPSEGPPTIMFSFYREPTLKVANLYAPDYLARWIRTNQLKSNFDFNGQGTNTYASTTVVGKPALKYHSTGLYEYDYVVFTYGEWVVVASAGYMDENTTNDFAKILSSITLKTE